MELTSAILIAAAFLVTTGLKVVSHTYFMLAFTIMNHLFPQGYLPAGNLKIPNHRTASFLNPPWILKGGQISHWAQYALVAVLAYWKGWKAGLGAFAVVFLGVKVVAVVVGELGWMRLLAVELMREHLTRRVHLGDFRWDNGTNEEGGMVFEALFKDALAWIEARPIAGSGDRQP